MTHNKTYIPIVIPIHTAAQSFAIQLDENATLLSLRASTSGASSPNVSLIARDSANNDTTYLDEVAVGVSGAVSAYDNSDFDGVSSGEHLYIKKANRILVSTDAANTAPIIVVLSALLG